MNHITEAWNTRLCNKKLSPTCKRILSSEDVRSPTIAECGSWRSRMFAKVKECRDAIKNMMTFDRLSNTFETRTADKSPSNFSFLSRATTSLSSIPDVVTFSSIALKHKEYEDVPILMRNSSMNSDEAEKLNTSIERIGRINNVNDSLNRRVSADDTISSSLKSFLALEKQIKEEFLKEDNVYAVKKRISAEPFLYYAEGTAEFIWSEDTTEESFSGRTWNSLEHLNSSDIGFGNPRTNSTFHEDFDINKNRTSSPIRRYPFQDSGFENNFSI